MDKLSACPFCGGEAEINQIGNEHTKSRGFEVKCLTWGCATKKRAMVIRQPLEKARAFAITAWNTRPSSTSSEPDDGAASPHDRTASAEHPSPTDLAVRLEDVARIVDPVAMHDGASGSLLTMHHRQAALTKATAIHALYAEALDRVTRERDEARQIVADCNNSLFGSHNYFPHAGGKTAADAIEDLKSHHGDQYRLRMTAEAALAASQEREGKMREALDQAAAWFEEYADHHQAKGALDKASRNLERANFLRRAGLNTNGGGDGE